MAKVFVSYSRKDIEFARRLTDELRKSDLDFWIDWEGIPPTVDWWNEIEKGIEEADIFLFLISPDSAKSKVCGQEIDTAYKNGKRIIPIVVREIEWEDTPPQLGHLNYIFFSREDDFETAIKKLLTAIHTDYEWAATHRRLQVKALEWERNNNEKSFLLRGKDLQDAELDLATNTSKDPHPTDLQREYVFASRKLTDRQRRITTGISIAAAIALAALALFGFYQADKATKQATVSRAGELAANSIALRDNDFQLSLLLGIEAYRTLPTVQSEGALFANAQAHPQLRTFISGNSDKVNTIAFSPDGKTLASGNVNGDITLWNISTRIPEGLQPPNQSYPVIDIAISPDGKSLGVSGGGDTFLWDISSGNSSDPYGVNPGFTAFSSDGNLWIAGGDGYVVLIDRSSEEPSTRLLTLSDFSGEAAAFSPDGKTIVYLDSNGNIVLWDISAEEPRLKQPIGGNFSIYSLALSPNGKLLASGNSDGSISLWEVHTEALSPLATLSRHTEAVNSVAFSPDGETLASGSADKSVILWDVVKKKMIGQPLTGHSDIVNSVAFSPDGKTLASGSDDTNIILWDVNVRKLISQPLIGLSKPVDSITFSSDSKTLATSSESTNVEYWEVATGKLLTNLPNPQDFSSSESLNPDWTTIVPNEILDFGTFWDFSHAFSTNGKELALGTCGNNNAENECTEGRIILFNTSTGEQLGSPIAGHTSLITSLAFSPDDIILASGGGDSVILWDLGTRQPIGLPISGLEGSIYSLTFSPDGNILAEYTAGYSYDSGLSTYYSITLWDINPDSWIQQSCERAGRNFTQKEWTQYFPQEPYPATKDEATCPHWRLEPEEPLTIPFIR